MSHMVSIPDFSQAKVLVVGDLMLDRYWSGGTARVSPEAPVPVVKVENCEDRLGGAANVAAGISALGAAASLVGATGVDADAEALEILLRERGVQPKLLGVEGVPTIVKLRVMSRAQQLLRVDFESQSMNLPNAQLSAAVSDMLLEKQSVLVLSDYAKGCLQDSLALIEMANETGIKVLVDPKGTNFDKYRGAYIVTPNKGEFEAVVGPCENDAELVQKGTELMRAMDWQHLLVTRSEEGMTLLSKGSPPVHVPTQAKQVFDVTGAGDTVIATLAAGLSAGLNAGEATILANLAAGVAVERTGTTTISADDLAQAAHQRWGSPTGCQTEDALAQIVAGAQSAGEKIVMTNGCFDILHPGHVAYLEQAKALGDKLIVAVNSDDSVKRLKGESRPVNDVNQRMLVLAGLAAVDWVVPFSEDTPARLIERLQPNVLVKGGDYRVEDIAGADSVLAAGGEVRVLDFVDGYSTSSIIERAR